MQDTDAILIQLLNISIQMLNLDFPDRATDIFKEKLDIVRCMTIQAIYLLKQIHETDRKERNKLQVSRLIRRYYQRFLYSELSSNVQLNKTISEKACL